MNTLYVKKKVMRMRLESQSFFGSMERGQPAVLLVEEVIPHFVFLLLFAFITDIVLKEVVFFNLHLVGNQIMWLKSNVRSNLFTLRVGEPWDRLPREAVSFSGDIQNLPGCDPVQLAVQVTLL